MRRWRPTAALSTEARPGPSIPAPRPTTASTPTARSRETVAPPPPPGPAHAPADPDPHPSGPPRPQDPPADDVELALCHHHAAPGPGRALPPCHPPDRDLQGPRLRTAAHGERGGASGSPPPAQAPDRAPLSRRGCADGHVLRPRLEARARPDHDSQRAVAAGSRGPDGAIRATDQVGCRPARANTSRSLVMTALTPSAASDRTRRGRPRSTRRARRRLVARRRRAPASRCPSGP